MINMVRRNRTAPKRIQNAYKINAALYNDAVCVECEKLCKSMYEDIEAALFIWFLNACAKGVPVSGLILVEQARASTFVLKHDFTPGTSWLQRLKDRHGITCKSIAGEAASVDDTLLQTWLDKNLSRISTTYAD